MNVYSNILDMVGQTPMLEVTRIDTGPPHGWLLANVHLGLLHLERRIQVDRLLMHLFEGALPDQPLVIAGDWNEWRSRLVRSVMNEHEFHLARTDARPQGERTWPSRRPLLALDKILYRDPIRCHHVVCVLDEMTRVASDHLPLMVELETPVHPRHLPETLEEVIAEEDDETRRMMIHSDFVTRSCASISFFKESVAQCFECMRVCPVGRQERKLK